MRFSTKENAMENKAMRPDNKDMNKNVSGNVKEMKDTLNHAKDDAQQIGHRVISEARDFLENDAPEYIRQSLSAVQVTAKRALETSEQAMRRNVWYSVLGAAGVGIALGAFLFRPRTRA